MGGLAGGGGCAWPHQGRAGDGPEPDRLGGRVSEPGGLEGPFAGLPIVRGLHSTHTGKRVVRLAPSWAAGGQRSAARTAALERITRRRAGGTESGSGTREMRSECQAPAAASAVAVGPYAAGRTAQETVERGTPKGSSNSLGGCSPS